MASCEIEELGQPAPKVARFFWACCRFRHWVAQCRKKPVDLIVFLHFFLLHQQLSFHNLVKYSTTWCCVYTALPVFSTCRFLAAPPFSFSFSFRNKKKEKESGEKKEGSDSTGLVCCLFFKPQIQKGFHRFPWGFCFANPLI